MTQTDHQNRPAGTGAGETAKREKPLQEHAHWRCDCVPDLGPAHCHRCSRVQGRAVPWDEAPCAPYAAAALAAADNALAVRPEYEPEALADETAVLLIDHLVATSPGSTRAATPPPKTDSPEPAPQSAAPASAPPSPATIAAMPPRRLVSASEAHAAKEPPEPWRLTALARSQAESFDVTPREVVERVQAATMTQRAPRGGINHYCDDLLILVSEDEECVISIVKRDHSLDGVNGGSAAPARKPKSGGPGRRTPSSTKELLALLKEHGFSYEIGSKGHYLATHPDHPREKFSVPATPSDKRSLPNCVAEIKRRTGIDITLRADGH